MLTKGQKWVGVAVGLVMLATTLVGSGRAQASTATFTDPNDTSSKLDVVSGTVSNTVSTITYAITMDAFAPSDVNKINFELDFNADNVADKCLRIFPSSAPSGLSGVIYDDCAGSFVTGTADSVSIVGGNQLQVLVNINELRVAGLGSGKKYGFRVSTLDHPSRDSLPPFMNDTAPDSTFVLHKLDKVVCGASISGEVTLTVDVTGCRGDGLKIAKDGTKLNLDGHTISSSYAAPPLAGTTFGVNVGVFKSVSISGPGTISNFGTGIAFNNSVNPSNLQGLVKSLTVSNSSTGIDVIGGKYVTIKKATVQGNKGVGIQVTGSKHTIVKNNVTGNTADGIRSPSGSKITFTGNTSSTNGTQPPATPATADGIDVDSTVAVLNSNIANSNDGDGISAPSDATGTGNSASSNFGTQCTPTALCPV